MMKQIEKLTGLSKEPHRLQERISEAFGRLIETIEGGVFVEFEVNCAQNNTVRVSHRLGKKPKGCLVVFWSSDTYGEPWVLHPVDLTKKSAELAVINVSGTGIYQVKVYLF